MSISLKRIVLCCFAVATGLSAIGGAPQAKVQRLRLYVFDCGKLFISDPRSYRLAKEEVSTPYLSVPCYLVAHPRGTLLWDVGEVPDSQIEAGTAPAPTGAIRPPEKTLRSQLATIGYSPADITYLALSHYHFDHSANANDYAGSTWLVRKADRDVMFGEKLPPSTTGSFFSALKASKTTLIDGELDVFGDGRVVILPTPGHTPGHQSLFIKLSNPGPVVLSGDLYHYPEERRLNRVPLGEADEAQTAASRSALDATLEQRGAVLWIEHDDVLFRTLKKAPEYYE
jgi:N-acyl homoserine lactone hydrolase